MTVRSVSWVSFCFIWRSLHSRVITHTARWLTYNSTVCRLGGNEAPGHVCHVPSAKLCWCLDARDGDWSCIANESGGSWQCSELLRDWLKVFRVGGAACGSSAGTGNPWQTLPPLLSALMESEESLEVASVSSTPPQKPTLSFSTSMPRLLTLHPPGATPILSWSLFISSVSGLRVLPLVNRFCLECNEQWWNVLLLYIHIHILSSLNYRSSNALLNLCSFKFISKMFWVQLLCFCSVTWNNPSLRKIWKKKVFIVLVWNSLNLENNENRR